jgi:hypothetical protein
MTVGAIWHNPGDVRKAGAGDYPVAIIDFVIAPAQTIGVTTRALAVDTAGHVWAVPTNELEIVDADVSAKLAAVTSRLSGKPTA